MCARPLALNQDDASYVERAGVYEDGKREAEAKAKRQLQTIHALSRRRVRDGAVRCDARGKLKAQCRGTQHGEGAVQHGGE